MNERNSIKLRGTVLTEPTLSHKINNIEFYKFDIQITSSNGNVDIIPVTDKNYSNQYKKDDFIEITGEVRTRNITDNEGLKHLKVEVYALEVSLTDNKTSLNEGVIIGGICKNKFRETKNGKSICNVTLGINRENQRKTDYVPVVIWNKFAQEANTYELGTELKIIGRLQSRNYIKDEKTFTVIEFNARQIDKQIN